MAAAATLELNGDVRRGQGKAGLLLLCFQGLYRPFVQAENIGTNETATWGVYRL